MMGSFFSCPRIFFTHMKSRLVLLPAGNSVPGRAAPAAERGLVELPHSRTQRPLATHPHCMRSRSHSALQGG